MMKKFLPLLVAASFCVIGHAADNTPAAPAPAAPASKAGSAAKVDAPKAQAEKAEAPKAAEAAPVPARSVSMVDAGFWFGCPAAITKADVKGVRFGLPVSSGKGSVTGLEWSLLMAGTDHVDGMQWTAIGPNFASSVSGLQFGFFNMVSREMDGAQVGLYNFSPKGGWQFGFVNFSEGKADWQFGVVNYNAEARFPVTLFVNF
ncbi:MAG: hypothetical protein AB7F32_13965 [Victivallaceae bacterium]